MDIFLIILNFLVIISPVFSRNYSSPNLKIILPNTIGNLKNLFGSILMQHGYPTTYWTTPEIVKRAGYPLEIHKIWTADGYQLTLHRIPSKDPRAPAVFLQHGILTSSACWVMNGNKSLAYILANRGYDVWLGNFRGNTYSRLHRIYPITSQKFWDFSYHEMGIYDLPASLIYVRNLKNDAVIYIGHSMGSTVFYVMASEHPEVAAWTCKIAFSLAPAVFFNNMKTVSVALAAPFHQILRAIFGNGPYFPEIFLFQYVINHILTSKAIKEAYTSAWPIFFGYHGFSLGRFREIVVAVPGGASRKTVVHFCQGITSGKFKKFDYGKSKNAILYKSFDPPEYNLTRIQVPTGLFYSMNDSLADADDVQALGRVLTVKLPGKFVKNNNFNHGDFLWGENVEEIVYKPIIETIDNLTISRTLQIIL